jgi:micrococcal nuclease
MAEGKEAWRACDSPCKDQDNQGLGSVEGGEQMLNAELVRQGYTQMAIYPPNVKYQQLFLELQREAEAREGGRGLWGK